MQPKFSHVIMHYAEIGLKRSNRIFFEKLLAENSKKKLPHMLRKFIRESGQITFFLDPAADYNKISTVLRKVPGVAYFSFAFQCDQSMEAMSAAVVSHLEKKQYETFKIETHRRDKNNEFSSMEVNRVVGDAVVKAYSKKVKMKAPDLTVTIEITGERVYISDNKIEGVGGIPIQSSKKIVSLLSGGFDSPVAAYLMMKRGCEVVLVHFQNESQITSSVENKIIDLASHLSQFQNNTKLLIVPFGDLQQEIIAKIPAAMRMLVYRRFMLKIASQIALNNKAFFLVVGDSLSQVASQTIENLKATYGDSEFHVLSPLIGMDKKEIIALSRKIGTYDISVLPYEDCCSYFVPKHPELRADLQSLRDLETQLKGEEIISNLMEKIRIKEW